MTPSAIAMLVCAATIIWGGLIVSSIYLSRRPEVDEYPDGDETITD